MNADIDPDVLDERDLAAFAARRRWISNARNPKKRLTPGLQIPPQDIDWEILLFMCGRGFGKTASLVEWQWWECWRIPELIGHWVAPTLSDVDGTAFEGPAGFRATVPPECLWRASWDRAFNRQRHTLRFANGSIIRGFGAVDEGGRLRGPQCHNMACDELREWDKPAGNLEQAMNNALFGLRLKYPDGTPGRALMATTPKGIPFLKRFIKRPGLRIVKAGSWENMANLSEAFRKQLLTMAGTMIGRQEIDAAFIDEEGDQTIIKRHWIKLWPSSKPLPDFHFILECYDTASSEEEWDKKRQETDPSGSAIFGLFNVQQHFKPNELKELGVKGRYGALLLDCWTERLGLPDLLDRARDQHRRRYGPHPGRKADMVLIEQASSGPGLRQFMAKWGVPTWPYSPRQSKTMRLHAASPIVKQGGLWVVESGLEDRKGLPRNWVEPFLEQVCAYAGEGSVEHDEYVDVLSSAMDFFNQRGMLTASPDEPHIDHEAKLAADRRDAEEAMEKVRNHVRENPYG